MVSNICEKDILAVANSLNIELNESQINEVFHLYQHEEECDTTSTWVEITENCIYQICNKQ